MTVTTHKCYFCGSGDLALACVGQYPTVAKFYACGDHVEEADARLRDCAVQSTALLKVVRAEDLDNLYGHL